MKKIKYHINESDKSSADDGDHDDLFYRASEDGLHSTLDSVAETERAQRSIAARITLKAFDIFSYVIGMLVRL